MTTADASPIGAATTAPPPPGLPKMMLEDLRWAFAKPYGWLVGIGVNLALSIGYLVIEPLRGAPHRDWAILVGTYFAVFILADVTTTNVLGVDTERTRLRLLRAVTLPQILLVKNLALLLIVGGPTLIATAAITLHDEADYRLELTLPGVLFPMLVWLGIGNVISVLLPYWPVPLVTRWRQRRRWRQTVRWLVCLGLPYALCTAVQPVSRLPRLVTQALHLPPGPGAHGILLVVLGLTCWGLLTTVAVSLARSVTIRFDDLR